MSSKGFSTTRQGMNKNDSLPNLPKIHKGVTRIPENSTKKILDIHRFEEMNLANDKYKNTVEN